LSSRPEDFAMWVGADGKLYKRAGNGPVELATEPAPTMWRMEPVTRKQLAKKFGPPR
jgi:hypothetical protein